ncbi:hypothetical protein [Streptomyces sp. KL116D]|uniref:hypothetical protein n=1 Tax=Streptomyces sp. KL116D TaxID=3045152 RepID=UPI00355624D0
MPTPAARRLAATVRDALDDTETAAREIARRPPTGPLTLSCEPTLLMRWLIPRLPDLAERAPGASPLHLRRRGRPSTERAAHRPGDPPGHFPFPADTRHPAVRRARRTRPPARLPGRRHTAAHRHPRPGLGRLAPPPGSRSRPRRTDLGTSRSALQAAASACVGTAIRPYALVDDLARGDGPMRLRVRQDRVPTCWAAARWRAIRHGRPARWLRSLAAEAAAS